MADQTFDFLPGLPVEEIHFYGPIRLVFERGDGPAPKTCVEILDGLLATSDGYEVDFDGFEHRAGAGAVLRLLHQRVAVANAKDGTLRLTFETGDRLIARPDAVYESWSVQGGGRSFQCLGGGGVLAMGR